ncbi:glycosyltransferase family 2 protein [candidate division KSB1 bacterium]
MYQNKRISLVIPAYNEEKLIKPTLEHVPEVIDHVYVIDDASIDSMAEVVTECARRDDRIELIQHEKNCGPGQAIITGYRASNKAGYDITVVVGGDYQMPLEQVESFLKPLVEETADYTKGNRFMMGGNAFEDMPKTRLIGNTLISLLTKIASGLYKIFDVVDGYTAITKRAIDLIDWDKAWKGYGYPMDFLIRMSTYGLHVKDIPRRAIYLEGERQSQIKGFKYALKVSPMLLRGFFWRLVVKYIFRDFHPLIFFYIMGLTLFPLGVLYGLYLVYAQIAGIGVSGPRAVLATLLITTGLQFLLFAMLFDSQESE